VLGISTYREKKAEGAETPSAKTSKDREKTEEGPEKPAGH